MEEINSEVSKKLNTFLPLDVFMGLTDFCKENAQTGLGKFDFGVGIRILLQRSRIFEGLEVLNERMNQLEVKIAELETKEVPETVKEIKTFADIKHNQLNKEGGNN